MPEKHPRNRLVAALSVADKALLVPRLTAVTLTLRQPMEAAQKRIKTVYFPESGIVSVVAVSKRNAHAEIAIIGREGMTGVPLVLGCERSSYNAFVQVPGEAHSIDAGELLECLSKSRTMRDTFLLFAHVLSLQSSHTALASAHGTIETRLARWLLMADDRMEHGEMLLTHEFLSLMLGVRRAGITEALGRLKNRRLIQTGRGRVTILRRDQLETVADGLYGAPEAEYRRVLGR